MAIVSSIAIGRASGPIGNVSFSTQKGRVIARQKPTVVSNPRTQDQRTQRKKFSSAVVAWYMIGNAVKSGITQLVGYGSQFNTYVSKNAHLFANRDFDKQSFVTADLANTFATIGNTPQLTYTLNPEGADAASVDLNSAELLMYAQPGDKLKIVIGNNDSAAQSYSEFLLTPSEFDAPIPRALFNDLDIDDAAPLTAAVWLESADGKRSSTSSFLAV